MNLHWKDWCSSWNSNPLAIWYKELFTRKDPDAGKDWGRAEKRMTDGLSRWTWWTWWTDGLTRWTWVWVSPRSWWWTGKSGILQSTGLQRVRHDWETELNWTTQSYNYIYEIIIKILTMFLVLSIISLLPPVYLNISVFPFSSLHIYIVSVG